ncbi:MAG: HNH endonuclease, partial [Gammaproteobacteria bacterium]|nr:HNH endonuclease [Gammaproteobacteria bacterium]
GDYLKGSSIRQEYLETAIRWLAGGKSEIETYMGKHQHDKNAEPLWNHFRAVIAWVQKVFPTHRKEMKGLGWGAFYAEFKDKKLDSKKLETEIARLMQDDDIKKKSGIYAYLLTGGEHHLNIR